MKFISLFTKAPDHKKFSFKPRYWNQEEEERKEREERIRKEVEREKGIQPVSDLNYRSRIQGSFQAARRRSSKPKTDSNAALGRSAVLLMLVLFLIAYLQWGSDALYGLIVLVPLYFYFRFKR